MRPALGCTEPGIIALACAKASSNATGKIRRVDVYVNAGIYKNAYTCGIPGTDVTGAKYAAALGALAGNADLALMALSGVTPEDVKEAERYIREDRIHVTMTDTGTKLFVDAVAEGEEGTGEARIEGEHTFFSLIRKDERILHRAQYRDAEETGGSLMEYEFREFRSFADTVPYEEILFVKEAVTMNRNLVQKGKAWSRCAVTDSLGEEDPYTENISAAIEARFLGAGDPAMSITGSGAHGLMCTVPLITEADKNGMEEEPLLRAIVLCFLVTMYIKECSGKLSAFCGCGIAGGLGFAYALPYLRGEDLQISERAFFNMASSVTGMICTGGNQACALKGVSAVQAALVAVRIAEKGVSVQPPTGILGDTVEETARNVGLIADPGMVRTDEVILSILRNRESVSQDYMI